VLWVLVDANLCCVDCKCSTVRIFGDWPLTQYLDVSQRPPLVFGIGAWCVRLVYMLG
jgi:hypothetical protein